MWNDETKDYQKNNIIRRYALFYVDADEQCLKEFNSLDEVAKAVSELLENWNIDYTDEEYTQLFMLLDMDTKCIIPFRIAETTIVSLIQVK